MHLYSVLQRSPAVLFFYVRAFTPVCAGEVCGFRDSLPAFEERGAQVLGIGPDSEELSRRFSQFHHLPYPLLVDRDGSVRKAYRVPKLLGLLPGRATYLVGQDRTIKQVTTAGFQSRIHVTDSLRALDEGRTVR